CKGASFVEQVCHPDFTYKLVQFLLPATCSTRQKRKLTSLFSR
ncbi:MAG: hypothetical protein AVDCRST_MAG56-1473, partial [uncultured Cytophagales bacterium]